MFKNRWVWSKSQHMKQYLDCEFIEDGRTIELISIAVVAEDGREFYAINKEAQLDRANDWVKMNVIPLLPKSGSPGVFFGTRSEIAAALFDFAGEKPSFWGYYCDYDWVAVCQLFGTMMDLPKSWPQYCRDLKQLADSCGSPRLLPQDREHDALSDARWNKRVHAYLIDLDRIQRDIRNDHLPIIHAII